MAAGYFSGPLTTRSSWGPHERQPFFEFIVGQGTSHHIFTMVDAQRDINPNQNFGFSNMQNVGFFNNWPCANNV